jgi:quercetin dioxygenase-like cupin family protein
MTSQHLIAAAAGDEVGFGMVRKVLSSQTHGGLCVAEATLHPGHFVPPHVHTLEDEVTRVLSGTLHVVVGDELYVAHAGAYVLKPRGVMHAFWNAGPAPAVVIELVAPGTMDHYFAELFALANAAGGSEAARRAAIERHQERYGVTFDLARGEQLVRHYAIPVTPSAATRSLGDFELLPR